MADIAETFDYEAARADFKLDIPDDFNFAFDVLAKQAAKADKTALIAVAADGESAEKHSFGDLERASNRFANVLQDLGTQKGDLAFVMITRVPMYVLTAVILAYCAIGVFALSNVDFDLWTLFLFGVAFTYAATGTVNLALLAERVPELPDATRAGIGLWFLVVFGTKAAIFPLFSWLPDSYPTAPTTITAVFAGLLTKIGVYVMIRFFTLTSMEALGPVLLTLAGITMLVGVAGALAQDDVKRILSFHVVSQIGYMLMGLGLFTVAGVAGAVLFLVHQIPVKTVLFLVGGLVEDDQGTSALGRVAGLVHRRPAVALLFALPALSLAGLPPFSGFVAKLALIEAGVAVTATAIVAVALVGSLLTLLSMSKIWLGAFWGAPTGPSLPVSPTSSVRTMVGATAVTVAVTLGIAVWAGPLWDMSERVATELVDRTPYIDEVLG